MISRLFQFAQRFYAPQGVLGRVLAIDALQAEAEAEAQRLTERHDVPQGDWVPEDLRDRQPRYLTTRDGYSIASLLHPNDKTIGSDSAAIGLAQTSLFVLGLITGTLVALLGFGIAILPVPELKVAIAVLALLVMAAGAALAVLPAFALFQSEKGIVGPFAFLFAIPVLAFAGVGLGVASGAVSIWGPGVEILKGLWALAKESGGLLGSGGWTPGMGLASAALSALIVGGTFNYAFGAVAPKTYKRVRTTFVQSLTGTTGAILIMSTVFIMPLWVLVPVPIAAACGLFIWNHAAQNRKARAQDLLMNSMTYSGLDQNLFAALNRHSIARDQQAKDALKDRSPFVQLGTSKGVLTQQMDGYAPDAGLPFGLTVKDLSTHALVVGPTGSGKTSGVLRPLIKAIYDARKSVDLKGWTFDRDTNPYSLATLLKQAADAGREVWLVDDHPGRARELAKRMDPRVQGWSLREAQARLDAVAPNTCIGVFDQEQATALRSGLAGKPGVDVIVAQKSPLFGMLIMDGKGALADEARGASDLVIEPGVPVGLIEGLRIEDLVEAVAGVAGAGASKSGEGGSGSTEFFNSAAREALRHATALYFAMCEQEERFIANGWIAPAPNGTTPRNWKKTWAGLTRITQAILQIQRDRSGAPMKSPLIEMLIDFLTASEFAERRHPEFGKGGLLDQAINYTNGTLTQDERTLGNISATLEQWMSPIMSHSDLLPWASMETGVDPSIVLRGGIVGINVPVFRYGVAGKIIQNLVRLRVATEIRRRSDYPWEAFGECGVILLIDEAQEVVTEQDSAMLAVARSLGGWYVCATQNIDSFQAKFGANRADAVMDQFRSVIGIGKISPDSAEFLKKRFGSAIIRRWKTSASALPFQQIASLYASMPFHDKNHPLRAEMRTYLRQGAGVWRNDKEQGASGAADGEVDRSTMAIDDHEEHGSYFRLGRQNLGQVELQQEWIYNPAVMDGYLSQKNHAVAEVMRAGVIRRDVIELKPVYKF